MRPLVLCEVRLLAEGLPTVAAFVGLLPRVCPQMLNEVQLLVEVLPAFVAFVRLLPRMCSLVYSQGSLLAEGLPTLVTLVRFLSCVSPLMDNKFRLFTERFSALTAFIGLHLQMSALMHAEVWDSEKGHLRFTPAVGPLCHVINKRWILLEGFLAFSVFKGFLQNTNFLANTFFI